MRNEYKKRKIKNNNISIKNYLNPVKIITQQQSNQKANKKDKQNNLYQKSI